MGAREARLPTLTARTSSLVRRRCSGLFDVRPASAGGVSLKAAADSIRPEAAEAAIKHWLFFFILPLPASYKSLSCGSLYTMWHTGRNI